MTECVSICLVVIYIKVAQPAKSSAGVAVLKMPSVQGRKCVISLGMAYVSRLLQWINKITNLLLLSLNQCTKLSTMI